MAVYPATKRTSLMTWRFALCVLTSRSMTHPLWNPPSLIPPAMSEEEALLLEQEGRAALSEMGEFVPDFDDAISQAEHRRASHTTAMRYPFPLTASGRAFPVPTLRQQAAYADFKAASHRNAQNFHITDDALGVGGAKAKFRANMAAIHLLKSWSLRACRPARSSRKSSPAMWAGAGLRTLLTKARIDWKAEFAELYAALSPEEYAAARASTLNAHYTSPTVIRAIYDAVENMGFQTGNILEPSMGVGNFFGMLPESMKSSRLYGVELDSITGTHRKAALSQGGYYRGRL